MKQNTKYTYSKTTKITFGDAIPNGIMNEPSGNPVFSKTTSWSTGGYVKAKSL